MDPRHPLRARTEWTADKELKLRNHLRQRASAPPKHDTGPHSDDAQAKRLSLLCLFFPLPAHRAQEVLSRRGFFGNDLVAPRPVIADRRGVEQEAGFLLCLPDSFDEAIRRLDAAGENFLLLAFCPPFCRDRFTGE